MRWHHRGLLLLGAVLALGLVCWLAAPAHAAIHKLKGWESCTAQATEHTGMYAVDNDLFAGSRGRSCITSSNGHDFTVQTAYKPSPSGGVVAYPDVRVGRFYASLDPAARFLPAPVRDPGLIVLHLRSSCRAPGLWLTDADLWFYASPDISGHGVRELVISNCGTYQPGCRSVFRIGHLDWCATRHMTGPLGHQWPLTVLHLVHPRGHVRLYLRLIFRKLRNIGWLPTRHLWDGSIAYGTECWSGCRGITDAMTVTTPHTHWLQPPPRKGANR